MQYRRAWAEYLIIFLVAVAAFLGEPWWAILVGTAALAFGSIFDMLKALRERSVPVDAKIARLLALSAGNALAACSAACLVGYFIRAAMP